MAENKTKASAADPDAYIAGIEDESRRNDCTALIGLMSKATKQPPVMWGSAIVGFGIHKYPLASGKVGEVCSVGFSSRKADISIYGVTREDGAERIRTKLGKHKLGKGCLYVHRPDRRRHQGPGEVACSCVQGQAVVTQACSPERRRLTPRSRRGPTANHQARAGGTRTISPARAWRLAVGPASTRTLGIARQATGGCHLQSHSPPLRAEGADSLRNTMRPAVREVQGAQDYAAVAKLIAEYVLWLRARYQDDSWFITEVLDKQSLSSELENLPGMYGPPNGRAFVVTDGDEVLGCGAYRRFDETSCEMKRVFVPSKFQGTGIGRRICNELLSAAETDGYASMKLDTGKIMREALGMYHSLGFEPCPPYYDYQERLLPYFVFLQRPLSKSAKALS